MSKVPVLPIRVYRQLNDPERNPSGEWSLVFSTSDMDVAVAVMAEQAKIYGKFGDAVKIIDRGETTWIEESIF